MYNLEANAVFFIHISGCIKVFFFGVGLPVVLLLSAFDSAEQLSEPIISPTSAVEL